MYSTNQWERWERERKENEACNKCGTLKKWVFNKLDRDFF